MFRRVIWLALALTVVVVAVAVAASQTVDVSKYSVRKLGTGHYRITYTPWTTSTSSSSSTTTSTSTSTTPTTTTTTSSTSTTPPSGPCALTHAAGADGVNSCWATHTGVQNGTGFTEAQILAGQSTLTHVTGNVTPTAGMVIDHEWIDGCVTVNSGADNVTIRNSLITGNGCQSNAGGTHPSAINGGQDGSLPAATGLLVQDTTIDGQNAPGDTYGVSFEHGSCIRCNVLGFSKNLWTGQNSASQPMLYQDVYSHDMNANDQCAHMNGWFLWASSYVTLSHSYAIMDGGDNCVTGAISIQSGPPTPDHITVDQSYAEGGAGVDINGGCGTNLTITNNALSNNNGYGGSEFSNYFLPSTTWSGNYVAETGAPVSPGGGC